MCPSLRLGQRGAHSQLGTQLGTPTPRPATTDERPVGGDDRPDWWAVLIGPAERGTTPAAPVAQFIPHPASPCWTRYRPFRSLTAFSRPVPAAR